MEPTHLPVAHPQYGALDVRDGKVVMDDDCPVCGDPLITRWTPTEARQLAAELTNLAAEAEREGGAR